MNCQSFETLVSDLARDQMMEASVRERALRHSAGCESCSLRLEEEQELTTRLRELSIAMRSLSSSAKLDEGLRAEFRNGTTGPSKVGNRGRYVYAAVAAVLLAVVGFAAIRSRVVSPGIGGSENVLAVNNSQPTNDGARPVDKTVSVNVTQPAFLEPPKVVKATKAKRARPPETRETTVASDPAREVTTEFLPIGYTSPVYVQEGGQVVRVELPRYAMARFGLPINMERFDEKVKADVLMGADGVARAIRFVQ